MPPSNSSGQGPFRYLFRPLLLLVTAIALVSSFLILENEDFLIVYFALLVAASLLLLAQQIIRCFADGKFLCTLEGIWESM